LCGGIHCCSFWAVAGMHGEHRPYFKLYQLEIDSKRLDSRLHFLKSSGLDGEVWWHVSGKQNEWGA